MPEAVAHSLWRCARTLASGVQASYVAARRYAVVDIGTSPCPIRAGGGVGGEEGVVAEVTLPMLRQAVGMPEGTQAAAEIVGGTHTRASQLSTISFAPASTRRQMDILFSSHH